MKVFQIDAFLDVVLGGVAILLVFLLVSRPAMIDTGYHRQADFAIGCFASNPGEDWNGSVILYTRDAVAGTETGSDWQIVSTEGPIPTFAILDDILEPFGAYSRAVIFVDVAGASCAHHRQSRVRNALNRWTSVRDSTIAVEIVPCASRAACEGLLGLSLE